MRRLALVLGGLAAFGPLSLDLYLPGLPELSRDLGVAPSIGQLTITACLAGLALGQLVAGPLSDRFGRRRPLLLGVALYVLASGLCALAPSAEALLALRFVQGAAGAVGIVVGRAVVRDLHVGDDAARLYSMLSVVSGVAPILAPVLGGQLLLVVPWQGLFVVLAGIGALVLVSTALSVEETLDVSRRTSQGMRAVASGFRAVASDRTFLRYALGGGLSVGAMFAYIAGSPFVLQEVYGLSPQAFSVVFALNGLGIVLATVLNQRLIGRRSTLALAHAANRAALAAAAVLLADVLVPATGVVPVLAALFVSVATVGVVGPNTTALALADHGAVAGSASAVVGVLQFLIGALAAPFVGLAGSGTAVPMAVTICLLTLAAAAVLPRRTTLTT
ncbi:MAG TPA: multidrug effflux MFS transporter [Solirubrobacteraceae bacterium]|nr:multidrug effflux MFS transporter [Solirubrobacteraceae bacterium]